jgi:hypothetical protein
MNLFDKIFWPVGILLGTMFTCLMAYNLSWLVPLLNNYESFEKDYIDVTLVEWHREDYTNESGAYYNYLILGTQESNGERISTLYKSIVKSNYHMPIPQVGERLPTWSSDIIPDDLIIMRYSEDFPVKAFQTQLIYAIVLLPISFGVTVYVIRSFLRKLNWIS